MASETNTLFMIAPMQQAQLASSENDNDAAQRANSPQQNKSYELLSLPSMNLVISNHTHTGEDEQTLVCKTEPLDDPASISESDHFEGIEEVEMLGDTVFKTNERTTEELKPDVESVRQGMPGEIETMGVTVVSTDVRTVGEVKSDVEDVQQVIPQQFIILTRHGDNNSVEFAEGMPAKFIRLDGLDGQTYMIAVPDDVAEVFTDPVKATLQDPAAAKNLKGGRKRSMVGAQAAASSGNKGTHSPSFDGINQAWFTTRDDKNALHNEGHKWKQGQWTKEEVDVLESNISKYCKDNNIKDPAEVIFEMSKDERKDFYRTIALGIQRPLFSVYRRVTRMYDRKNHRGKYSQTEMKYLRVLRAKHGTDWAAIGGALGRSASSVKDKCRLMKDNCNAGKWFPEEEARLAAAVYELTGVKPSESITSGLSWASVSEHVGTRSEKQCRTKWLNYLNWKQQGGADWTREDDTTLIDKVSKMSVNNDSEIDWVTLSQDWASVRSPQWLRGKWWALKRHITDYNKLTYTDLLEQMKRLIFCNLKQPKLNNRQLKDDPESSGTSSDIFKSCFPVSLARVDGQTSLSLSYCPSDDDGFQAFEVLQQWTPQIIGTVTQGSPTSEGSQGILSTETGHIIVQTLAPSLRETIESIQLDSGHQVLISTSGVSPGEDSVEDMSVQVTGQLVQTDQDLNELNENDNLNDSSTFSSAHEEIVTDAEFTSQSGDPDIMSHVVTADQDMLGNDVFETVTSQSGGHLVMSASPRTHAMTSLKDPILMSSSDVECDKSQSAVLTDESSDITD